MENNSNSNNNFKFKKGFINAEDKTIKIEAINNNNNNNDIMHIDIDIGNEKNDNYILQLIDLCNRHYSATLFNINKTNDFENYGCLTSKVVGLNDIPLTFINAKYIINLFLKLLQCLLKQQEDQKYFELCQRDEINVQIPTSEKKMSLLIHDIMNICSDNMNGDNSDNDEQDIKDLFLMILNHIVDIQSSNAKKINSGKFQKQINIHGGIHNIHEIKHSLQDNINETMHRTGESIHKLIFEYKNIIYQNQLCQDDLNVIKIIMDNNPNTYLYQNVDISFQFMMKMIGNLFNTLFVHILPQKSMINCLHATLYQASVFNELNILKHYSKIIHLPLLYRLIYSFYKDNSDDNNKRINTDDKIYKLVNKLCQKETDIAIICEIASKLNISNVVELNSLYWLLNEKRGYTYEFYLIIIITLFIAGKCQNMSKMNKISNGKTFGEPLYDILYKFYTYVTRDLADLQTALCTNTFDNFNKIYSSDIKKCLQNFIQNVQK